MITTLDELTTFFESLLAPPLWTVWLQLGLLAAALPTSFALTFAIRQGLRRRTPPSERGRRWPFAQILFAALLWAALSGLQAQALPTGIVRLAALAATATAASLIAFRLMGYSILGWLAAATAVGVAILATLGLVGPVTEALDGPALMFGELRVSPWFVLKAIGIAASMFWIAQQLGNLLDRGMAGEVAISRSGQALIGKLARAGLLLLATLFSLAFLGVDVTALAVLSGAVGLGLGFGLQNVVSNYVAGLILLMDRSIKPGDVIELDFGAGPVRGEVTELAGRYTAITLRTGTETLIPNEMLVSNAVSNWSHTSRDVQLRIPVGVSYSTDVEQAMALCREAASTTPRVLATHKPTCFITGFGDSSVDLEVRFWIADAELGIRNVSSDVFLAIWKLFKANSIEIPFPQRDLHIRSAVSMPASASGSANEHAASSERDR
ncbi:MAG TPA: mechanosensitive ion channel [Hyphomonadaceae bacterium]|nr:mechanosensitive ion channel [Hyphomonadaceae bacterium]HPN06241.1 mechanosensitive ion channel [Hyphomonadaceae bacterium]